jgi:hypothetical protein
MTPLSLSETGAFSMGRVRALAAASMLAVIGLLLATVQQPVGADQSWYAAQKRKMAALATASTDCIARHTLEHPGVLDAYRAQELRSVIESVKPRCADEIDYLSREYANLHGWGAGHRFVAGPYNDDLPRAILKRIGDELGRRVALAESEVADLQRSADLLRNRMYECTRGELAKLVRSTEVAAVLATAALTICRQQVTDALEEHVRLFRVKFRNASSEAEQRDFRDRFQRGIKEWVVTDAVRMRAENNSKTSEHTGSAPEPKPGGQKSDRYTKALITCLETVRSTQETQFSRAEKLVEVMTELCRPEIEGLARAMFLADSSVPLDRARENALKFALVQASRLVGVRQGV